MASNSSVATLNIFATRRACENACWGASPNPHRRKVRFVPFPPCGENGTRSLAPPLPTQPASLGLRRDPIGCGPVLMLRALTLGQNVPKQKRRGTAQNCSPVNQKMWKVVSNIGAGHINILPPQRLRPKTLANRALFSSKCSHINNAFLLLWQQKDISVGIFNNTKLTLTVQRLS